MSSQSLCNKQVHSIEQDKLSPPTHSHCSVKGYFQNSQKKKSLFLSTNIDHVFVTGSWSPHHGKSELMDISTWTGWKVTLPYLNTTKTISHQATLYYNEYFYVFGGHNSNLIGTRLISTSLSI